ncbi:MAG: AAA family ATPase [Deltaproteobacteria bacterium]|nr:AAA family ATPase [Deltaproteobacteria bacterium]
MICPKCQHMNPNGAKFCMECGGALSEAEPSSSVVQSERKLVTVLFSDMSGYTAMTERLDPEGVRDIMSRIFGEIAQVIAKYDGFIERFIGDAVMAVFGVPRAHEDDPVRTIRAAMEIHTIVENLSPKFEDKIGRPLTMHSGINTGLVVTGSVDLEKGTHGLTGNAINLASRFEGLAEAGEIVVGQETYKHSMEHFGFEALGPVTVKGKAGKVNVFKVNSTKIHPATLHRTKGLRAEIIGRDNEMTILSDAMNKLDNGRGSIISVVGEAGTGKSRLIKEFKATQKGTAIKWHEGRSYAYTENIPYYPLINLLSDTFQIKDDDSSEQIRKKLEVNIKALLGNKTDAFEYIGDLFSVRYQEEERGGPEVWRMKLYESIFDIVGAFSKGAPTVICFEDLHWADSSFVDLIHEMLNVQHPVLFLLAYRPDFSLFPNNPTESVAWPYKEISLKALSKAHTRAMLESLLRENSLPSELDKFVMDRVEGNPFYLEEMINSLIDSNTLVRQADGWRISQPLDQSRLPTTIKGLLSARLDRLENKVKRVLQEASVIGRAFSYEILRQISDVRVDLDACLAGLTSSDLIQIESFDPDLEYEFKHSLIQEVAYESILKQLRRQLHGKIGSAIEKMYFEKINDYYEILGYHFSNSNNLDKAFYYLKMSGIKSTKKNSSREALRFFKKALAALSHLGESTENLKEKLDITLLTTFPLLHMGYSEEFLPLLQEGVAIAKELGQDKDLALLYGSIGSFYAHIGMPIEGIKYTEKAYEIAREIKNIDLIAPLFFDLCAPYIGAGEFVKTVEVATAAIGVIEANNREFDYFGKPINVYSALCARCGGSMGYIGEFEHGEKILQRGLQNAQRGSDDRARALLELYFRHLHLFSGHWEEAVMHYQSCIEYSQKEKWTMLLSLSYSGIGKAFSFLGRNPEAIRHIEMGLKIQTDANIEWWLSLHYWFLAIARYHQTEYLEAIESCRFALNLAQKNGEKMVEGLSLIWLGRLLNKSGLSQTNETEDSISDGIGILEENRLKPFYAMGYFFLGEFFADHNDHHRADGYFLKARTLFKAMGMDFWFALAEGKSKPL